MVFASPPATFKYLVDISVDGQSVSFEMPELAGHVLSLEYPGATADDQNLIATAGGILNVRPWQVFVAATVKVDGVSRASFDGVNPGTDQQLTFRVTVPGGSPSVASNHVVAGGQYAVLVDPGLMPQSQVAAA